MESMRKLSWLFGLGTLCALAYAQRPPIAWIGGGEVGTYEGFYFRNEQYFVTNTGYVLHFWRLSDNKLVRSLTLKQLTGRWQARVMPTPDRQKLVVAYPDTDSSTGFRGIRIKILQPDAGFDSWTTVAAGGSFIDDADPEDEPGGVRGFAISPDGQYIAVGGGDAVFERAGLVLYRVQGTSIERVQYLIREPSWAPIFSAAFSPTGEWLFAGSAGGWVFVYRRQPDGSYAYHQRFIIGGNGYYINCFTFANRPDGQYVAVGVLPNGIIELRRYNPNRNEWRLYLQWHTPNQSAATSSVNALHFSPDGNRLAAAYGTTAFGVIFYDPYLRVYQINYSSDPDSRSATPLLQQEFPADVATVAVFNANARELISSTRNGDLRRWNLETQQYVVLPNHRGFLNALAWSPDGAKIATSAQVNYSVPTQTFVWDVSSQSVQARIDHLGASWIGALAFSPDSNYIATVGRAFPDRTIDVWNANTGDFVVSVGVLSYNGSGLAFSPDGQYLYAAARNGEVRAFQRVGDWSSWSPVAQANAPDNGQTPIQIALSPDGSRLAVGTTNRVQIYSTPNLTLEREVIFATAPERVMSLAWSPDGRYIAAGTREVQPAPVYLIETSNWSVRRLPTAQNGYEIYSVAFTPDGCYLAGAGSRSDNSPSVNLMLWHTSTGTLAAQYDDETLYTVYGAAFSPDGRQFAYVRDDGSLVVAHNPFYRAPGDADRNGCVNNADLLIVLFNFGMNDPDADLNCDGIVNNADLLLVLFHFGNGC